MWVIKNRKESKGLGGTSITTGINGIMGCKYILVDVVGVHDGIPMVKGLVYLCVNRLEEPVPPIVVIFKVVLTPSVLVGIKQDGREGA